MPDGLESHLDIGEHSHARGRSETVYDQLRRDWAEKFFTVDEETARVLVGHSDETNLKLPVLARTCSLLGLYTNREVKVCSFLMTLSNT